MRRPDTAEATAKRTRRTAFLVSFVVPLIVLGLLLTIKSAHAAMFPSALPPTQVTGAAPGIDETGEPAEAENEEPGSQLEAECHGAEGEEGPEEAVEVEASEEAEEEGEEEGCATGPPPRNCLLRSASAQVTVYTARDKLRLLVDYATYSPTRATVELRLEGHGGSPKLAEVKKRLAGRGVVSLSERLSKAQMAKLRGARDLLVEFHIPAAPRSCHPFLSQRLKSKRTSHSTVVWSRGH